ncbi:MAG TPA: hypothetical protein VF008_30685 [Niastella sp.]
MEKASKYIYDFLDDNLGIYYNPQEIEFIVNNDDSVFVNHVIKDPLLEAYIEFGLFYASDNFNEFMRDFGFTSMRDLKALSPDRLWELYYKGQAEVYCILAVKVFSFALYFRLAGNTMFVRDDRDAAYELGEILQTRRQFVEFTQQRFLLNG